MKVRKRQFILAGVVFAAFGVGVAFRVFAPREPEYQGKNLSEWLEVWRGGQPAEEARTRAQVVLLERGTNAPHWFIELGQLKNDDSEKEKQAIDAVRTVGTNGIPTLLRMLQYKDSRLKRLLKTLLRKQSFIRIESTPSYTRPVQAINGFLLLGVVAKPAIPELGRLLHNGKDGDLANYAALALAMIGPEALPALTNALADKDSGVRCEAARAFTSAGPIGPLASEAEKIVPLLIRSLKDSDANVRSGAAMSLGVIGREPDIVVPALIANLQWDQNHSVRQDAASALGAFENRAKPAVPRLLNALNDDPSSDVRSTAGHALKRIDPEAAAKAGVK